MIIQTNCTNYNSEELQMLCRIDIMLNNNNNDTALKKAQ